MISTFGEMITVELPPYENPPKWIPPHERKYHPDFNNDVRQFLPRTVKLRRGRVSDALGFNVRGGKEYLCGIYISKVMPGTEAERLRLREGDQILKVNDVSFENIEHSKAVKILKANTTTELTVRYFPYGYNKTYEKSKLIARIREQREARQPMNS